MDLFDAVVLCLVISPIVTLAYVVLVGGKECYLCGERLNETDRPMHHKRHRVCRNCWIRRESEDL